MFENIVYRDYPLLEIESALNHMKKDLGRAALDTKKDLGRAALETKKDIGQAALETLRYLKQGKPEHHPVKDWGQYHG